MLEFNNNHIFTGYIKQLLASFNLPMCKVYSATYQRYLNEHGEESPEILKTIPLKKEATEQNTRYIPYIRNGQLEEYLETAPGKFKWKTIGNYFFNEPILNYTKNFRITNNIYDNYTHEYLGDFLRFLRDYFNFNLMSLYNCFSNRFCTNLELSVNSVLTAEQRQNSSKFPPLSFDFDTCNTNYKIYMLPVKLGQVYTIAIDSPTPVEMFCGLYNKKYISLDKDLLKTFAQTTYTKYGQMQFNQPVLFSKLSAQNLKIDNGINFLDTTELVAHEQNLKLFIKLPASNKSSIVILEGDYRMNLNGIARHKVTSTNQDKLVWQQNYVVTNFENPATGKTFTSAEYADQQSFKPISRSQLLMYNTGKSYPFADRLIEYLIGNAVTPLDDVTDNVLRAETVVYNKLTNPAYVKPDVNTYRNLQINIDPSDLWDFRLQPIFYNFLQHNKKYIDRNYDVLGFVDKDIEQVYSALSWNSLLKEDEEVSIANIDIYADLYKALKVDDAERKRQSRQTAQTKYDF